MSDRDWMAWHEPYDRPGSSLARRLDIVQARIRQALDAAPAGPINAISMCAGQGRDLLGAIRDHPRRSEVRARLVELDETVAAAATDAAASLRLSGVEVVVADASLASAYAGMVPADLVLVCGVFGNVGDDDIRATVTELPHLCATGATVVWTRHRREPDITPVVRQWFADSHFTEVSFDTDEGSVFAVGTHRFTGRSQPFRPDRRLFHFTGDGTAPASGPA